MLMTEVHKIEMFMKKDPINITGFLQKKAQNFNSLQLIEQEHFME